MPITASPKQIGAGIVFEENKLNIKASRCTDVQQKRPVMLIVSILVGLVMVFVVVKSAYAAPIIIDDFTDGQQSLTGIFTTVKGEEISSASSIGGWRKIAGQRTAGGGQSRIFVRPEVDENIFADEFQIVSDDSWQGVLGAVWDGGGGDATTINYVGLGGINLRAGDNDGVLLRVVGWDSNDADISFILYTDENNYATAVYPLRGTNFPGPFTTTLSFDDQFISTGNPDFENIGAIALQITTIQPGVDLRLNFTLSSPSRDFGDLPDTYRTTIVEDGPRHSLGNVYLGSAVDTEIDALPGPQADTDSYDDGIERANTPWQNGTDGGAVAVTWVSAEANGHACLSGWIDWEQSGNFDGPQNQVVQSLRLESAATPLTQLVTFDVPADYFDGVGPDRSLAARWRIYPVNSGGTCDSIAYFGFQQNGEVEDYLWGFTPTAVSLINFQSGSQSLPWLAGLVLLLLLTSLLLTGRRRVINE